MDNLTEEQKKAADNLVKEISEQSARIVKNKWEAEIAVKKAKSFILIADDGETTTCISSMSRVDMPRYYMFLDDIRGDLLKSYNHKTYAGEEETKKA